MTSHIWLCLQWTIKVSKGILYGRPFGGTGILWRKNLGLNVKLIHKNVDGRSVTISLFDSIMITCVYFPCQLNNVEYTVAMSNICADIEGLIQNTQIIRI